MRSLRFACLALLLCFASALGVAALPRTALAATIDVSKGVEVMYLKDYDMPLEDMTVMWAKSTTNQVRLQKVNISDGSISYTEDNDGYSTGSNYSGAVRTTANGYPYVSSFVRDTAYDYIYIDTSGTGTISTQSREAWYAKNAKAADPETSNTAVGIKYVWSSDVMPAGSGFYVFMPYSSLTMKAGNSTLSCNMTGLQVYAGPNTNELEWCEYDESSGIWTTEVPVRVLLIMFDASNRSVANLSANHDYYLYGTPSVYVMLSDVNIVNLQNNIESNVEDQTEQIMSTDGSDSIVDSTSMGNQVNQIESIGLFDSITGIADQLHNALNTSESNSSVVFPGLNIMGFRIASAEIDVWEHSPIPQNTVRGFITFTFVIWYIRYMIALIDNIFGLDHFEVPAYEEGFYDVGHWEEASTFRENTYRGGVYKI